MLYFQIYPFKIPLEVYFQKKKKKINFDAEQSFHATFSMFRTGSN